MIRKEALIGIYSHLLSDSIRAEVLEFLFPFVLVDPESLDSDWLNTGVHHKEHHNFQ